MIATITDRINRLSLGTKFSLALLVILVLSVVFSTLVLGSVLQHQAENNVTARGEALLGMINAVRGYTSGHIRPLLADEVATETAFTPERVPAFSARAVFDNLREITDFEDFTFKEATPDPMNPSNQADAFEVDLMQRFINDPGLGEVSDFRTRDGERVFFIARPLLANNASCLDCHGDPAEAPPALIASYGDQNGFGWQVGDVIAVQTVYVPAEEVLSAARRSQVMLLGIFVGISLAIIGLINFVLKPTVIRPIAKVAEVAAKMAEDSLDATSCAAQDLGGLVQRGDEIGQLALVFQNTCREVYAREERLRTQLKRLRIEIDQVQQKEQVAQITETDYFRDLQSKARTIRARRSERDKTDDS